MQDPAASETAAAAHQVPPGEGISTPRSLHVGRYKRPQQAEQTGLFVLTSVIQEPKKMTHSTLTAFPWISRTKLGTATERSRPWR